MGADMSLRSLYLTHGSTINHATAEKIRRLCREATIDDLTVLLDGGWFDDEVRHIEQTWTDDTVAAHAATLRQAAEAVLLQLFDQFIQSLGHRDVTYYRFGQADEPGVDVYATGGLNSGDSPTEAFGPGTSSTTPSGSRRPGPPRSAPPPACCTPGATARPSPPSPSAPGPDTRPSKEYRR
jgi:hypothetical protein